MMLRLATLGRNLTLDLKNKTFPNLKGLDYHFSKAAKKQYLNYQITDYRYIKRIRRLLQSILDNGHREGLGHPEFLRSYVVNYHGHHLKAEEWSRRVTRGDRLVYVVIKALHLFNVESCRTHYEK